MINLILGIIIGVVWGIVCVFIVWSKERIKEKACTETLVDAINWFIKEHYQVLFEQTLKNGQNYLSVSDVADIAVYFTEWQKEHMHDSNEESDRWSRDDERIKKSAISFLDEYRAQGYENAVECIDWLEAFKDRLNRTTL